MSKPWKYDPERELRWKVALDGQAGFFTFGRDDVEYIAGALAAAREALGCRWLTDAIYEKGAFETLVKMLAAFARHAAARQEWVSVESELPHEDELVEVCGSKRLERAMAYRHGDEWLIETCSDSVNIYPPQYWRKLGPLPAAPQSAKEE